MTATWLTEALSAVENALTPTGTPLEFTAPEPGPSRQHQPRPHQPPQLRPPQFRPRPETAQYRGEHVAAVVRTSGSTGTPKQTLLSGSALEASAEMTASSLGGHGQWLLALHPSYVAGLAVLTRSVIASTTPVPLLHHTTDPERFTEAANRLNHSRRYTALVPTQLATLLAHADPDSPDGHPHGTKLLEALQRFDAILLGGGPTSDDLFTRARELDLAVIRTYGMAETAGGCVYDGYPLPGVTISTATHGRVLLSGPMTALGYWEDPELTTTRFDHDPITGQRRIRTDDIGELSTENVAQVDSLAHVTGFGHSAQIITRLNITGRADDVVISGGIKVSAQKVRAVVESHPQVREAFVAGIQDPRWGESVAAAVVLASISRSGNALEEISDLVRSELGPACVPKHYELMSGLPILPSGKPDRVHIIDVLHEGAARGQHS